MSTLVIFHKHSYIYIWCEVCVNSNETSTFTSTVTGETYIINHRFNCSEKCLVYLLTCNKCKTQDVGQTIDRFWSRWNNTESDSRKHGQRAICMQQHLFNHFCTSGHCGFLEDVSLTFIDKTDPSDQLKREDGEAQLRLWHHLGLILKKVSSGFISNMLSICIFIGLVRFQEKDFWIYGGDFIFFSFSCCYFGNYLLLFLLFLLSFVVIFAIIVFIIVITFMIGVTIFICIYLFFYFFHQVISVYIVIFVFINSIIVITYIIFISICIVFIATHLFLFLFLLLLSSRLFFFLSFFFLIIIVIISSYAIFIVIFKILFS